MGGVEAGERVSNGQKGEGVRSLAEGVLVRCLGLFCFCCTVYQLDNLSSEDMLGEAFGFVLALLGHEEGDVAEGEEGEEFEVAFDVGVGGAEKVLGG
jgi:hypothetical protein